MAKFLLVILLLNFIFNQVATFWLGCFQVNALTLKNWLMIYFRTNECYLFSQNELRLVN